ncbi:hypothetical protein DPEC_G00108120 [Dallia pectoralis]|uniref:Uncharacterized protein n=1 Tax=Dallia pectoralis TaxID=75939 RepID=A0ACC2GS80_DALPE|nr:hypothetical protein DPEC_G00108120 [Dallia pectoralis]
MHVAVSLLPERIAVHLDEGQRESAWIKAGAEIGSRVTAAGTAGDCGGYGPIMWLRPKGLAELSVLRRVGSPGTFSMSRCAVRSRQFGIQAELTSKRNPANHVNPALW